MCIKTSCRFIRRLNLATTWYFSNFIEQQIILNHKKKENEEKEPCLQTSNTASRLGP